MKITEFSKLSGCPDLKIFKPTNKGDILSKISQKNSRFNLRKKNQSRKKCQKSVKFEFRKIDLNIFKPTNKRKILSKILQKNSRFSLRKKNQSIKNSNFVKLIRKKRRNNYLVQLYPEVHPEVRPEVYSVVALTSLNYFFKYFLFPSKLITTRLRSLTGHWKLIASVKIPVNLYLRETQLVLALLLSKFKNSSAKSDSFRRIRFFQSKLKVNVRKLMKTTFLHIFFDFQTFDSSFL